MNTPAPRTSHTSRKPSAANASRTRATPATVLIAITGILTGAWMGAGFTLFGISGPLMLWYLPTITTVYCALQLWLALRLAVTTGQARKPSRRTKTVLALSWGTAILFGLTVPENMNGTLTSIVSLGAKDPFVAEMSIALCNPLGICAFVFAGAALIFAHLDVRPPRPHD